MRNRLKSITLLSAALLIGASAFMQVSASGTPKMAPGCGQCFGCGLNGGFGRAGGLCQVCCQPPL